MTLGAIFCLAFGVGVFAMALYDFLSKKTRLQFRVVYRAKEPGLYWFSVGAECALGVFIIFIGTWKLVRGSLPF